MPPSPRLPFPRTHLLLDWDSTLTLTDTLSLIARIRSRLPSSSSPSSTPFSTLTNLYTTDLTSHTSTYTTPAPHRRTVPAELTFLESLREIEERSVRRVEEAGVFRGVTGRDVDGAAGESVESGEVVLRRGWEGCVRDVLGGAEAGAEDGREGGKGKVSVVSVGWSARFIRGCLLRAAAMRGDGGRVGEMVRGLEIVANEIEGLEGEGGSRGMLSRWFREDGGGIWTAGDKGRVVRWLIAEGNDEGTGRGRMRTVYVGDSVTDLECLLLVDVGICVRDEPLQSGQGALREVLERVGVRCRWIGEMEHEHTGWGNQRVESGNGEREKGLWWARDFEEIRQSALFCGTMRTGGGILDGHLSDPMPTAERLG